MNTTIQPIIDRYNGYIPFLVDEYVSIGRQIVAVSMSDVDLNGPDQDTIWAFDPTHPGNAGFKKIANNFFYGIQAADQQNRISAPQGNFRSASTASIGSIATNPSTKWASMCDYNQTWGPPKVIFQGPDNLDAKFHQSWSPSQDFTKGTAGKAVGKNFIWLQDYDADVGPICPSFC